MQISLQDIAVSQIYLFIAIAFVVQVTTTVLAIHNFYKSGLDLDYQALNHDILVTESTISALLVYAGLILFLFKTFYGNYSA